MQRWAFRNLKRKALVAQLPHLRKLRSALTNYFQPLRKLRCASRKVNPSCALLRCELKKYIIVCALLRCELKRIWLLALRYVAHCRKLKYCVALCRIDYSAMCWSKQFFVTVFNRIAVCFLMRTIGLQVNLLQQKFSAHQKCGTLKSCFLQ